MFNIKRNSSNNAEFKCGKIKELLEKMSFISDMDEGESKWSQAECSGIRKLVNSLRYEIRSCKSTWGEGSNLETALGDVLHVLDCISNPGKANLSDMDVGYAYMGRIQGLFFVQNGISSHCPDKYEEALDFFSEEKEYIKNALSMEKRTLAELSYDKVANAEAMKDVNIRIDRQTRHIHILNDMIQGTKYMMLHTEKEMSPVEDCDAAAEAEGDGNETFPEDVLLAEETHQPLTVYTEPEELISSEILTIAEEQKNTEEMLLQEETEQSEKPAQEEPGQTEKLEEPKEQEEVAPELSEQLEEPVQEQMKKLQESENMEEKDRQEEVIKPQIPTYQKRTKTVSMFHFAAVFFHREKNKNPEPKEQEEQIQQVKETRITIQDSRMVLYAPERCLFLAKNGDICYGLSDHLDNNKIYSNKDQSAYVLRISRNVYDLLTVRYDSSLFTDLNPEDLSDSRKIMQWIYENSLCTGNRLPLNQYVDYQAYYSLCVEQFLAYQEKEHLKRLQAELVADEIAELAVLYNRVNPEDIIAVRDTYIQQILDCELEQIRMLIDDIAKKEVSDTKLKERMQELKIKAENASGAGQSMVVQSSADEKGKTLYSMVCSNTSSGTVERAEGVLDPGFFDEVRNMRLLLKKEDINGDMEIKAASFYHISYLVKQFYIMLSYSRELGIDYNGQHIWLIRYDSERRMPVPVMSMYEKHIRHLDRGKTGTVICYMEQKYQYLLEMYAGMNE